MTKSKKTAQKKVLIELFDPTAEKPKTGRDKLLLQIVMEIARQIDYEIPNSATFAMALDSLQKKGIIFSIRRKTKDMGKTHETESMTEVA